MEIVGSLFCEILSGFLQIAIAFWGDNLKRPKDAGDTDQVIES